ncbi:hypothetical protein QJQ45_007434 [Haematococcus lacustris]|nr:hypothetical protein QJQ45_007434 [Haematococcus lacustris]
MSLVAQCIRGSGPVPRSKSRIRLKARENKVIKVPGDAVLRGCKKTRCKLKAHFQLRAEVHSQLRVIASLFASSDGTSLVANLKHITVTLATWDAVWEVYLDPKWAQQRLRLYEAQDRALEHFLKKLEEDMAEVSMERHGHARQLVLFFGAAGIGTAGGWGADCGAACLLQGGWKPPAGQVEQRLVRPAWSQQRDQPVRGLMWCPVVPPRKPPQAPRSSQAATQPAASEPGPSTPPPAKRSKRTKAEQAAEPTQPTKGTGQGQGCQSQASHHSQAALNMQRIGESRWRPLELCYWPDQGALPARGKEYPGLGYKRLQDKPPKAQEQQQPAVAP